jgi:hypothetical protein
VTVDITVRLEVLPTVTVEITVRLEALTAVTAEYCETRGFNGCDWRLL